MSEAVFLADQLKEDSGDQCLKEQRQSAETVIARSWFPVPASCHRCKGGTGNATAGRQSQLIFNFTSSRDLVAAGIKDGYHVVRQ